MAHFLKKTKDRLYEHIGQCITRRKMPQGTNIRTHYAMKVFLILRASSTYFITYLGFRFTLRYALV